MAEMLGPLGLLWVGVATLGAATAVSGSSNCSFFADYDFQCGDTSNCSVDMPQHEDSATACAALCESTDSCWAAAWDGPTAKTCYMKPKGTHPVHRCDPARRDPTTGIVCRGPLPTLPTPPPPPCSPAPAPKPVPHPEAPCNCSQQGAYTASVVARSVGPDVGSSLISKVNGSSDLEFNCERPAACLCACVPAFVCACVAARPAYLRLN